jgi:hypothetical protein
MLHRFALITFVVVYATCCYSQSSGATTPTSPQPSLADLQAEIESLQLEVTQLRSQQEFWKEGTSQITTLHDKTIGSLNSVIGWIRWLTAIVGVIFAFLFGANFVETRKRLNEIQSDIKNSAEKEFNKIMKAQISELEEDVSRLREMIKVDKVPHEIELLYWHPNNQELPEPAACKLLRDYGLKVRYEAGEAISSIKSGVLVLDANGLADNIKALEFSQKANDACGATTPFIIYYKGRLEVDKISSPSPLMNLANWALTVLVNSVTAVRAVYIVRRS